MTQPNTAAFEADATAGKTLEELQAENARLRAEREADVEVYDANGREVTAETKNTPDVSNAEVVEVKGEEFRFFPPKPAALVAFGMGASAKRNVQMQMAAMRRLLTWSLIEEDFDKMMDRMSDPADEFSEEDMADLVGAIADKVRDQPEAKAPKNGPRGR